METELLHVSTKMTGKMQDIQCLNSNTLSNAFCLAMQQQPDSICASCYSFSTLAFRLTCVPLFERNSRLLANPIAWDDLPRLTTLMFRIHAHGELQNDAHMLNVHNLAAKNPRTTITIWTKRKDIINRYHKRYTQPDNLIIIFSNPATDKIMPTVPQGFNKTFNVVTQDSPAINCVGRCMDCTLGNNDTPACYTLDSGQDCIVEHIKQR